MTAKTAIYCNILQYIDIYCNPKSSGNKLLHKKVGCNKYAIYFSLGEVTIADAVTVAVTVAIAITDASSSHRIHFPSSASPLLASTSFPPPIVSWRLLSFAGRLIVTSLRRLHCPICRHRHLIIVLFVAPSADCAVRSDAIF